MTTQERGAAAETRVLQLLTGRGWQLLDRNWRCRWGELDLLLVRNGLLLLVEVKGRRNPARGSAEPAPGPTPSSGPGCQLLACPASTVVGLSASGGRGDRSPATGGRGCALVPLGAAVLMHS